MEEFPFLDSELEVGDNGDEAVHARFKILILINVTDDLIDGKPIPEFMTYDASDYLSVQFDELENFSTSYDCHH